MRCKCSDRKRQIKHENVKISALGEKMLHLHFPIMLSRRKRWWWRWWRRGELVWYLFDDYLLSYAREHQHRIWQKCRKTKWHGKKRERMSSHTIEETTMTTTMWKYTNFLLRSSHSANSFVWRHSQRRRSGWEIYSLLFRQCGLCCSTFHVDAL